MNEDTFLLLQIRNADDPMRNQEVGCFARALGCGESAIQPFDLLSGFPTDEQLRSVRAVLIGGSGDYSAAADNPWLEGTLAGLRHMVELGVPTFASCWGFQAIARACGGRCIHDPAHAELGTISFRLTEAGRNDPLFGTLPQDFLAQAGHEDHVVELPPGAVLLASSNVVTNQAFRIGDAPVYCTQFHPELDLGSLIGRVERYPRYVESIDGRPIEEFIASCRETPDTQMLLRRFRAMIGA